MRHCLIICALLLAGCGRDRDPQIIAAPTAIPADLLVAPKGYTGPTPRTEGQLADAAAADKGALMRCTGQLLAISDIAYPVR